MRRLFCPDGVGLDGLIGDLTLVQLEEVESKTDKYVHTDAGRTVGKIALHEEVLMDLNAKIEEQVALNEKIPEAQLAMPRA